MDQGFYFDCSLILDSADGWGYAREPVLAVMPDGSLLCTLLSGGPLEPDNRNVTLAVRSFDAGRTWTEPEVLFYHRSRAAYTTEIFTGVICADVRCGVPVPGNLHVYVRHKRLRTHLERACIGSRSLCPCKYQTRHYTVQRRLAVSRLLAADRPEMGLGTDSRG